MEEAFQYATASLSWLPPNTHWRIKLELADMSKRLNDNTAARRFYEEACDLQPIAWQCWQERSKFEEDCGNVRESLQVLTLGLQQHFHEALLMRALRDFNIPKIVREDEVVFFGLLGDLFPGIDPPRKVDPVLEEQVLQACINLGNHPDEV